MLDERGALGQLVWVGCGALGDRDGRIALYRRERAGLLTDPARPLDDPTPLHRPMLDHLERRGASFFAELSNFAGEKETLDALWDLVWAGLVTNDTFAPLRALAHRGERPRPGRSGANRIRMTATASAAGRWSLVSSLVGHGNATRRAHARALALLDRWGVVSRDALASESVEGGFSAVYPVLRAMEEAGEIRRGLFVEGLGSAQFAFAGTVDQLRAVREADPEAHAVLLAAADPANPYGAILPWPATGHQNRGQARRSAGARVVLLGGEVVLFLDRGGRQVLSFSSAEGERLTRAATALSGLLADRRRRALRIERIDGEPALDSALRPRFESAGFRAEYKGLALDCFHAERTIAREE